MLNLTTIHTPHTLDEALQQLQEPGAVALAGGSHLLAHPRRDIRSLVDLGHLRPAEQLAYIRDENGAVAIGALTRLADLVESPILRSAAGGIIARAAHRTTANLLRNQGTLAGTLLAEPDGILAVALAALDARVTVAAPGSAHEYDVLTVLDRRADLLDRALITRLLIPHAALGRRAVLETVARTPRDRPIVSVCAALELAGGVVRSAAIALGGVAPSPQVGEEQGGGATALRAIAAEQTLLNHPLDEAHITQAALAASQPLQPPSDVRGSSEYRREMARVLLTRALREVAA